MALSLRVDPVAATPLHRQVYDSIRAAILDGALGPGDRLPPSRVLATRLSVARATVTQAYEQLQVEGYLNSRAGSGTFVAPLPAASARPHSPAPVHLSSWARRLADRTDNSPATVAFDLRPHRIALDAFPWDAWRGAVDAALAGDRALLASPPPAGLPHLRESIAAHIGRFRSVHCSPEQVVVVSGSQQGLNLLTQLLTDPGDRVAMEDPGYPAARLALEAHGLDVTRLPVDNAGLDVDRLHDGLAQRFVLVTPSQQEPTGATLSLPRRLALLDYARDTGALIIEDDYDSEFRFEGSPIESLQGLDHHQRVIYAGTFSKSLLPGLRLGFLVVPPDLIAPVVAAKTIWDSGSPTLEQAALAEFLVSGEYERHIRRMRRLYRGRRDAVIDALQSSFGCAIQIGTRSGGLNLLVHFDSALDEQAIAQRAARAGVALRPASDYYAVPPKNPTFLLGFGGMDELALRQAAAVLHTVLVSAGS